MTVLENSLIVCSMMSKHRKQFLPHSAGSRISQRGCANLLFGKYFAENCMKMKEIGPGVGASLAPPWIYQCHINKLNNTPFQKFITVVLYLCSIEFSFNYLFLKLVQLVRKY